MVIEAYARPHPFPSWIPAPAEGSVRERTLAVRSFDGARLLVRVWTPTAADPPGCVLFLHGIGMHSAPYRGLVSAFTSRGLAFAVPDLRGHGLSSGRRGVLPGPAVLARDLDAVWAELRAAAPAPRSFMGGESMGGLLASEYALQRQSMLSGLAVMVPAFQVHSSRFVRGQDIVTLLRTGRSRIDTLANLRDSSRDEGFVRAKEEDPLVNHVVSLRYLLRLGVAGLRWHRWAGTFRLPLLMQLAGRDRAISNWRARAVFRAVGTPPEQKTLRVWEEAYHTLGWDPETPAVMGEYARWIRDRATSPE